MAEIWLYVYGAVIASVLVLLPFAMFYYECEESAPFFNKLGSSLCTTILVSGVIGGGLYFAYK